MLLSLVSQTSWLMVVLAVPVVYYLTWLIYTLLLHPLSGIPGPSLPKISRLWYLHKIWTEDVEKHEIALHAKHGSLVRIAPNEVSCSE